MYSTLLYASIRKPDCNKDQINKILVSANKNNAKKDVTGVLLYNKRQFFQYLEGHADEIWGLYTTIKQDSRHKNIILISYDKESLDTRLFPEWAMGGNDLNDGSINYQSSLTHDEKEVFDSLLLGQSTNTTGSLNILRKLFK